MAVRIPRHYAVRTLLLAALAGALFAYLGNTNPATGNNKPTKGVEHRVSALEDMVLDLARDDARLRRRIRALEDEVALLAETLAECCGVEPPPPPQCELDEDCPAGLVCRNGRCVPDPNQDFDQDGFTLGDGDCNDTNANIYPGAPERQNGLDDDCDGSVDEGFPNPESDEDEDGFTIADGDCDDANPNINPIAPERENGLDDDCDGTIDEGF